MPDIKKKASKAAPARPKLQTPAPKKRNPVKRKPEHAEAIRSVSAPVPVPAVKKYQMVLDGAIWGLVLGLTGYIALALATFDLADPSLFFIRDIKNTGEVINKAGLLGAYLADLGYHVLGLSVWWLVAGGGVWLFRHFRRTDKGAHSWMLFGVGLFMVLFFTPVVERLLWKGKLSHILKEDAGGWLGSNTTDVFLTYLGKGGSLFVLSIFLAVGLKLLVQFSYRELMVELWKGSKKAFDYLAERNQPTHHAADILAPSAESVQIKQPWLKKLSGSLIRENKTDQTEKAETLHSNHQTVPQSENAKKNGGSKRRVKVTGLMQKIMPAESSGSTAVAQVKQPEKAEEEEAWEEGAYRLPSVNLLRLNTDEWEVPTFEMLQPQGNLIVNKLAEFGIKVELVDAVCGPVITRYEIRPAKGVKGSQIINLYKDLARSMAVESVRVVEAIHGKDTMGIEVPNDIRHDVLLHDILSNRIFRDSASKLTVAVGKNLIGSATVVDLEKMPHVLIAGMTGSGKSVGVNAMIMSILFKAKPDEVRFIMIDPKMLELSVYEGIAHLLCPVVTDMKAAGHALNWCVAEMEKRYRTMMHIGVRNLAGYNAKIQAAMDAGEPLTNPFSLNPTEPEPLEVLPQIVIVIDELADLMMMEKKSVEVQITRIAQKARAAGMHMIVATQRPSVDVMTGLIKANIPTRMAFTVQSKIDSRTILDMIGAEDLLKQGDLLFLQPGHVTPTRLQGAFVSDEEVHKVVAFIKSQAEPNYVEGLLTGEAILNNPKFLVPDDLIGSGQAARQKDELFNQAVEFILSSRKTSISSLQRGLRIGYNRAANLMQLLEEEGVVSSTESNGTRRILMQSPPHSH